MEKDALVAVVGPARDGGQGWLGGWCKGRPQDLAGRPASNEQTDIKRVNSQHKRARRTPAQGDRGAGKLT